MVEKINEQVPVIFIMNPFTKKIMPVRIQWRGREYTVKKLGFHYKVREGRKLIHIYTVSTETLDFKLRFDTDELVVILEEAFDGIAD